jgi:putative modified peptide
MTMYFDTDRPDAHESAATDAKHASASNKFPADVAGRLLDKLASDDEFRALFLADARAAMRAIGFETPAEHAGVPGSDPIVCCLEMKQLAPKEMIAQSRARLVSKLSAMPFHYAVTL